MLRKDSGSLPAMSMKSSQKCIADAEQAELKMRIPVLRMRIASDMLFIVLISEIPSQYRTPAPVGIAAEYW